MQEHSQYQIEKPGSSLREAREQWDRDANQLVLLLSAISSTLDRGHYEAAREQMDAATVLAQRAAETGRKLIETGVKARVRTEALEADPVIAAILVLDPGLEAALGKFGGELLERLKELKALRQEHSAEVHASRERSERLLKRQLAEKLLQGVEQPNYLPELSRILGVEIPPESLLILPSKDLGGGKPSPG